MNPQENREQQITSSVPQVVGTIAHVVGSDTFATGERARLRRWAPGFPPSLAFYRFAFRYLPTDWNLRQEQWLTLVAAIALLYPNPHRPDLPLGKALAETGYSEARLERLLTAERETLSTLLLRAARFLKAKNTGCNYVDLAYLLGLGGEPQQVRLKIARDYYRETQRSQEATPGR